MINSDSSSVFSYRDHGFEDAISRRDQRELQRSFQRNPEWKEASKKALSDETWVAKHGDLSFKVATVLLLNKVQDVPLAAMEKSGLFQRKKIQTSALLRTACRSGGVREAEFLIDRENIEARSSRRYTALAVAVSEGHKDVVRLLLKRGADIEATNDRGETPLIIACRKGHEKTVQLLLENGANLEAKDDRGWTALAVAIYEGYLDIVEKLLAKGADIEATNDRGETPLIIACGEGRKRTVQLLLENEANLEAKDGKGWTALAVAVYEGDLDIVEKLLAKGADIEAKNDLGETPLIIACGEGRKRTVQLLLENEANLEAKDGKGWTALAVAVYEGDLDIVEKLLAKGADIEAKNDLGETPLIIACRIKNHEEMIELLLKECARIDVIDNIGNTPLEQALHSSIQDPSLLKRLFEGDLNLTQGILRNKELANKFGIKGYMHINDQRIDLEGWADDYSKQALEIAIEMFYEEVLQDMDTSSRPDEFNRWVQICNQLSPDTREKVRELGEEKTKKILKDTLEGIKASYPDSLTIVEDRLNRGLPTCLITGDITHSVAVVLLRNEDGSCHIARCNRGRGAGGTPGILIDIAKKVDIRKLYPNVDIDFFSKEIGAYFESTGEHYYIRQKRQKVGNCTVANTNSMELAMLVLQLKPHLGYPKAVELGQAIKKSRCEDTRVGTLRAYLDFYEKNPQFPINLPLLNAVLEKKNKNSREYNECRFMINDFLNERQLCPKM